MLFGRAQEEIDALEGAGIRYEVVPGVTAALAACAELGISLTRRGSVRSVALVTPRVAEGEEASDWATSVAAADCGAIYMGTGQAEAIASALIAAGSAPTLPVAVVERASLPDARIVFTTLAALGKFEHADAAGPALIFVGPQFRARAHAALLATDSIAAAARGGR
jgi:uroporphyrin-III C-methyltransferase